MRQGAILVAVLSLMALGGRASLLGRPGQAPETALNTAQKTAARPVSFAVDIRPILETRCVSCHGDALMLSDLSLATRDALLKGGKGGAAIVPGRADASRLFRLVAGLDMPPMAGAPALSRRTGS